MDGEPQISRPTQKAREDGEFPLSPKMATYDAEYYPYNKNDATTPQEYAPQAPP